MGWLKTLLLGSTGSNFVSPRSLDQYGDVFGQSVPTRRNIEWPHHRPYKAKAAEKPKPSVHPTKGYRGPGTYQSKANTRRKLQK